MGSLRNRVAELEQERVELLTKLKAVDDELESARNALRKETDPECQLRFISQVEATSSEVIALLLGDGERRLMHLVPAPAVRLMKRQGRWREKTHASSPSTGGKTYEKTS